MMNSFKAKSMFKSNIMNMDLLPSVSRAYSLITREESHRAGPLLTRTSKDSSTTGLSHEQVQQLLGLLERTKERPNNLTGNAPDTFTWILDSGASNHMTGKKDLLHELQPSKPMPLYFPDGSKTIAMMVGCVDLSKKMIFLMCAMCQS